jgi:hypothetical protein
VKEKNRKTTKNHGERTRHGCANPQRNHCELTSFMIHPVTDNITYLILLSLFTYTHAYTPAHAYMPARIRQGGKEEKSSSGRLGVSPLDRHRCPNGALCVANSSLTRPTRYNATVGQLWPFNQACQTGRFNRYSRREICS